MRWVILVAAIAIGISCGVRSVRDSEELEIMRVRAEQQKTIDDLVRRNRKQSDDYENEPRLASDEAHGTGEFNQR